MSNMSDAAIQKFIARENIRRDKIEEIYLTYAAAILQGFISSGKVPDPEDVFYATNATVKEHIKCFKAFWKEESNNV